MSMMLLLVIADPKAPYLEPLSRLPKDLRVVTTEDPEQLKTLAPQADLILHANWDSSALTRIVPLATKAKWIHGLNTGVESMLTPEMLNHPAPFTNGRGVFRGPLADWVAAAMLFFAFDFPQGLQRQEQRVWKLVHGRLLDGQTLGVIGYGSIGKAAAARAQQFGMKIAALSRRPGYTQSQLKEMMSASDYLLLSAPLTPETRGMIGEAELAVMKPSAVLINIGRAPVVDEPALIRALQSQKIRGAALDVFHTEPLPKDHPFWAMRNVLLSPHTADRVEGYLAPAFDCFFENLDRFLDGQPLLNIVDKKAGY